MFKKVIIKVAVETGLPCIHIIEGSEGGGSEGRELILLTQSTCNFSP